MPILQDFLGKKIDFLGSNQNVNLTQVASYTIFTLGNVAVRAQAGKTWIAFVVITPNGALTTWDPGLSTFNVNNQAWALNQQLSDHAEVPAIVFPKSAQTSRATTSPSGTPFTLDVLVGNANNGIATVAAYGWEL